MKADNKVTDKKIVEALLSHEELTASEIGKLIDAEDKVCLIIYHLNSLVDRKVLTVEEKKIGSKYRVNEKYLDIPKSNIAMFTLTVVLFLFAAAMTISGFSLKVTVIFLFSASVIGIIAGFTNIAMRFRERTSRLLELVS